MSTALKIGAQVDKASADAVATMVDKIFASARRNGMEQETVRVALCQSFSAMSVNNTTLTGCTMIGEKHVS